MKARQDFTDDKDYWEYLEHFAAIQTLNGLCSGVYTHLKDTWTLEDFMDESINLSNQLVSKLKQQHNDKKKK